MKKNALLGLAVLAIAFFSLTSADYKSLEEQNAAIEKTIKTRVDEFISKKTAECDAMVDAKARAMADQMIAALPKSTFSKPKTVAPAPAKKPAKPAPKTTPKAVKPAPKPAPAPAPAPVKKENEVKNADPLKRGENKNTTPTNVEPPKVQEVKNANPLKRGGGGK
jgi:outer membrane biosynthesis protein TonB